MVDPAGATSWRPTAAPLGVSVLLAVGSTAPAIVVPVLYTRISADLPSLTATLLGVATTTFFAASSVSAPLFGRLADRLTPGTGVRASAALTLTAIAAVGLATSTPWLLAGMAVAGAAHGFAQTVGSLTLSAVIGGRSAATQFGVKQSSIPLLSLVAGASLSVTGVSWRFVLACFALVPIVVMVVRPVLPVRFEQRDRIGGGVGPKDPQLRRLLVIASTAGLGISAAATFGVVSLVDAGWSEPAAGRVYAIAAALSLLTRVLAGMVADRLQRSAVGMAGVLLLVGAAGFALLAVDHPVTMLVGVLLACGLGWSYSGLLTYAVAVGFPGRVGQASGWVQAGAAVGVSAGPALHSALQALTTPATAWGVMAGTTTLAAATAVLAARHAAAPARREVARSRGRSASNR